MSKKKNLWNSKLHWYCSFLTCFISYLVKYSKTILHIFLDITNKWWATKLNGPKVYKKIKGFPRHPPTLTGQLQIRFLARGPQGSFPPESEGIRWCQHSMSCLWEQVQISASLPELPPSYLVPKYWNSNHWLFWVTSAHSRLWHLSFHGSQSLFTHVIFYHCSYWTVNAVFLLVSYLCRPT